MLQVSILQLWSCLMYDYRQTDLHESICSLYTSNGSVVWISMFVSLCRPLNTWCWGHMTTSRDITFNRDCYHWLYIWRFSESLVGSNWTSNLVCRRFTSHLKGFFSSEVQCGKPKYLSPSGQTTTNKEDMFVKANGLGGFGSSSLVSY